MTSIEVHQREGNSKTGQPIEAFIVSGRQGMKNTSQEIVRNQYKPKVERLEGKTGSISEGKSENPESQSTLQTRDPQGIQGYNHKTVKSNKTLKTVHARKYTSRSSENFVQSPQEFRQKAKVLDYAMIF